MYLNFHLFCTISLCLSLVHFTNASLKTPEIILNLQSVTSFEGLEQFYRKLQDESNGPFRRVTTGVGASPDNPTRPLEIYTKWEICKNILSHSFHFAEETLVYPEDVRQELKDYNRRIFWDIFKVRKKTTLLTKEYHPEYANVSRTYPVLLDDGTPKTEEAFTCVVRDRQSPKRFKRYLVSDNEYDATETGEFYVIGRFVFVENEDYQLVVHAFAEQPAVTFKKGKKNENELEYLLKRAIDSPVKNAEYDPICQLTSAKKLRLCTSVMTGFRLKLTENVKFIPRVSNVEYRCRMKKVVILTASLDPDTDDYTEWVVGCKVTEDDEPTTYYISQGYDDNEVMVFKEAGPDWVNVHHISRKVGVITKVAPREPASGEGGLCESCQHELSDSTSDSD